jgi:subtilisin-like proprotein convertase family protein
VTRARHWTNVPEQKTRTISYGKFEFSVKPRQNEIVTAICDGMIDYLEHVVVQLSLEFMGYPKSNKPGRGDIQLELMSPHGTTSTILPYRSKDTSPYKYDNFEFMSVHFWGEDPAGDWQLTIRNRASAGNLKVSNMVFEFYGTASKPQSVSNIPPRCDTSCRRGCAATGAEYCDSCQNFRIASTLECVDQCPEGMTAKNGYCYDPNKAEPQCARSSGSSSSSSSSSVAASVEACTDRCGRWVSFRARLACMAACKK